MAVFENCALLGDPIEVDKCIERVVFRNCDMPFLIILHQSSAPDHLFIENCNLYQLWGTPKHTTLINSHINTLTIGPRTHGVSETLHISGCHIPSVSDFRGFTVQPYSEFTDFTNGVLTLPKSIRWTHAAPGARFVNSDEANKSHYAPPEFIVLDITTDGTPGTNTGNVYYHTTLAPSFNFGASYPGTAQDCFMAVPCARISAKNCTGSLNLRALCQQDDDNPLYTHSRALLTGNRFVGTGDVFLSAYGRVIEIRINVLRAQVFGGGSLLLYNDFGGKFASDLQDSDVLFGINLEIAGERIIAPGGNTGAQSGDTLPTINEGDWLSKGISWKYNRDLSSFNIGEMPIVNIEVTTDQGYIAYQNVISPDGEPL